MNQREAVRAFAEFVRYTLGPAVEPGRIQDVADKWCDAQKLEPGRHLNEMRHEIKPAPMA